MGWEQRGRWRYYYRARKENGRTVKEYFGSGEAAEIAARLDARRAVEREDARFARIESQAQLDMLEAEFERLDRTVHFVVSAAMQAAGFRWRRGEWRRMRMDTSIVPATSPEDLLADPKRLRDLQLLAATGDREALAALIPVFDKLELVETMGNVPRRVIGMVVSNMVGDNLLSEEAMLRRMEQLRQELAGPNPSGLEKLLVDRVVATWLHLHKLEGDCAVTTPAAGADSAGDYQRAVTLAQRRYLTAIRELVALRRNAPELLWPRGEAPELVIEG